jgi:D-glycero-alpha-D-manno-heptose 1-phosphate guanylyltransferase
MEAVILAGGIGTRLRTVIKDVPKPMAPVNDKPFLFYLLHWISRYTVEKIILSVGYKPESISNYFGNSFENIPLIYETEENPLGTGGAIVSALRKTTGSNILIINGDTWFPVDLNKFYSSHISVKSIFSIALKRMQKFSRYGSVECREGKIIKFNEKKFCEDGLINGGIYLVNRSFFESRQFPDKFSLEKDILVKAAGTTVLNGVIFDDPFIDIGTPEDYRRAATLMKIK